MALAGVASLLAARLLGPHGRGQYAAVIVCASLASAIGDLGISQACSFYSAQNPREVGAVAGTAIGLGLASSGILLLILEPLCSRFFGGDIAAAARLYLFSVPFTMAAGCLTTIMLGLGHFGRFNFLKITQAAGYVAGIAGAWLLGSAQAGAVLTGVLLFQAIGTVVAVGCVTAVIPLATWRFDLGIARNLLSYGIRTYGGNLCWLANGRLDQALLTWLAPMRDLGIYAVAVSYSNLQFGVSAAIATVAFSRTARSQTGAARRELGRGLILSVGLTLPLAVVMALVARPAMRLLYGAAFVDAAPSACILLLGGVFLGANYVSSNCMRAGGRPGTPVIAEAGGLIVTLLALPFAIAHWGIIGAAWGSVASYAVTSAALAILWKSPAAAPARYQEAS